MKKILIAACALVALPTFAAPPKKAEGKPPETTSPREQKRTDASRDTTAFADLKNAKGETVGEVRLQQTPNGLITRVKVWGLPKGEHAFHIHEVGQCEPPFKSAGGHYNPRGHEHGIENPKGKHAGDLPNLHIDKEGIHEVTFFLDQVTLTEKNPIFDGNGSAFVIHAGPDDYSSDPAGNAGDRIACGVVQQ